MKSAGTSLASARSKRGVVMRNDNRRQTLLEPDDLDYETMKHSNILYAGSGGGQPPPWEMAKAAVLRDGGGRHLM
jgi:hypothetical protein